MYVDITTYRIKNTDALATPALIYYESILAENLDLAINITGGPDRLWPHIKSHKMREPIRMQMERGISRFKCATVAEARMLAELGAPHILLAYPLVGPNIDAYLRLLGEFPASAFYAIGDDHGQLSLLSERAQALGVMVNVLIDVNMGMDRTGIPLEDAQALYAGCARMPGLSMRGLHGYDGHASDPDPGKRAEASRAATEAICALRETLIAGGYPCELLILGGTPSFPIHARRQGVYLSPGTIFLLDGRYMLDLTDLPMKPAAMLAARVISHPAQGLFTLDLGTKAISTDMEGRGLLLSVPGAVPVRHSEEHWVFRMPEGQPRPAIGEVVYVLPMHICTTTMLYPWVHVARGGEIVGRWALGARDRWGLEGCMGAGDS